MKQLNDRIYKCLSADLGRAFLIEFDDGFLSVEGDADTRHGRTVWK